MANPSSVGIGLDPDGLRSQYLKDQVKEIPVQSYKLLHQCFHPSFEEDSSKDNAPKSDIILIFEEQLIPRTTEQKKCLGQTLDLF